MAACDKDIVHTHKFGLSKGIQLLIVVCTARTVKSYLINAIWQLITDRAAASALKVTVPTGTQLAASNIHHGPRCGSVGGHLTVVVRKISNRSRNSSTRVEKCTFAFREWHCCIASILRDI